ncbi:succinate dehydrogenase, hydrophobic membrane anchor protein, partial [Francisella tularensis subsp. holarctica]|nr:succinate dehydrogenase, hydrophobic membrane anchor protein [Francisella tularensis subsp. holarctica]
INYDCLIGFFTDGMFFRVYKLMVYLAMFFHAWVCIWIICGDYIKFAWAFALVMLSFVLLYIFCFFWLFSVLFFY